MRLAEQIHALPQSAGVYFFRDAKDRILYIGKAKRLKTRLLQYIRGQDDRRMVDTLLRRAVRIEATLTNTEKEALILEANAIAMHKPPFNVKLLDGGSFLYICLDQKGFWPYTFLRRKPKRKKGRIIFGPFPSAFAARKTLEFVERRFSLRTCSDAEFKRRKRPCLQYQMHQCLAPCVQKCTQDEYDGVVRNVSLFLKGKNRDLIAKTKSRMIELAEEERFEEAAKKRDLLRALEQTLEPQTIIGSRPLNCDVWGIYQQGGVGQVCVLPVRGGTVQPALFFSFENVLELTMVDRLSTMLHNWYDQAFVPKEILVPNIPVDAHTLEEILRDKKQAKVSIIQPKRGEKYTLLLLSDKNARSAFERSRSKEQQNQLLLKELQRLCNLPVLPSRIECFDNSHLQGSNPVASMVVFINGVADKSRYRIFSLPDSIGGDDYGSMRNVLQRRFLRAKDATQTGWEQPDLLIVDGGRGQLSIARSVLKDLKLETIPAIALAKPKTERAKGDRDSTDKIIVWDRKDPIRLPANHKVLHLLQRIRDESHRKAVSFQSKKRQKKTLKSQLDGIAGVGPKRKKQLIKSLGSIAAIRAASVEELAAIQGVGAALAKDIYQHFHGNAPQNEPNDSP
ncbi:MAG: excinuclease ABC subunit UvrC [Myxococcota bacterium]|nr:excinuclease ABC subunit UvrC [Myxococcota bacterium]